jgi:hypothetical protein
MAIPEAQLETWSAQGSITQSASTYETIRNVLNDANAPYHSRDYSIFLQGSYGNNTNVWKDSDVDVVMRLDQTFYPDTDFLTEAAKASYERARNPATYGIDEFKAEVIAWLQKKYGDDVKPGKKAIFIKGSGTRRDADVIVCAKHRLYWSGSTGTDNQFAEGICFWTSSGTKIVNFPEQHRDNCTTKHQATNSWFKPTVRVFKNMRNRMIDDKYIAGGVASSYFIEGMLSNVPAGLFGQSYDDCFANAINWVLKADREKLTCANGIHWLVRDDRDVCWSTADCDAYLAAALKYWKDWS